ncbi:MAG: hypothetical protein KC457_01920, partial [Myxococcales bacterium]|nr:hypothetical protein [Myxococcales bacterium]
MSAPWTTNTALIGLCLGLMLGPPARNSSPKKEGPSARAPGKVTTNTAPESKPKPARAAPKVGKPPTPPARFKSKVKPPRAVSRPAAKPPRAGKSTDYAKREKKAPRAVSKDLKALRKQIDKKNYGFSVGYTEAMDKPVTQLAGLDLPAKPLANAAKQNATAQRAIGGRNLMVRNLGRAMSKPARAGKARALPGAGSPLGASSSGGGDVPASLGNADFADMCSPSADAFSWHDQMGSIRNQGACGSCWAFAAVGTLEASNAIINGGKTDLSEQHALSCSGGGNCSGGWYTPIYDWLGGGKDGLKTETALPYKASANSCGGGGETPYEVEAWAYVDDVDPQPKVDELKAAMCKYGPLTAAVAATPAFIAYAGGTFDERSNAAINHAVMIV